MDFLTGVFLGLFGLGAAIRVGKSIYDRCRPPETGPTPPPDAADDTYMDEEARSLALREEPDKGEDGDDEDDEDDFDDDEDDFDDDEDDFDDDEDDFDDDEDDFDDDFDDDEDDFDDDEDE